jgi:flagellin FlaB
MAKANRKFRLREAETAVVGVGTLIVFIAMILVAAIASAVIIKTAYSLKDQAERVGESAANEATGGPKILDIVGDRGAPLQPGGEIVLLQFTLTTWDGSEAIDIETMRVHYVGFDQEVYLTLSTLTPNTPSATNFGCDEIPNNNGGNMWDEGNNLFWLDDENVLWLQIDLTNLNGIGDMLDPNEKVTVTFIPAHGPPVSEEFVTPTNFGGARYIDLTST